MQKIKIKKVNNAKVSKKKQRKMWRGSLVPVFFSFFQNPSRQKKHGEQSHFNQRE